MADCGDQWESSEQRHMPGQESATKGVLCARNFGQGTGATTGAAFPDIKPLFSSACQAVDAQVEQV